MSSFTGGDDYSPLTSSLTFESDINRTCVDIDIFNDIRLEDDEQLLIEISTDDRVDIELSTSIITIRDDDSKN